MPKFLQKLPLFVLWLVWRGVCVVATVAVCFAAMPFVGAAYALREAWDEFNRERK